MRVRTPSHPLPLSCRAVIGFVSLCVPLYGYAPRTQGEQVFGVRLCDCEMGMVLILNSGVSATGMRTFVWL